MHGKCLDSGHRVSFQKWKQPEFQGLHTTPSLGTKALTIAPIQNSAFVQLWLWGWGDQRCCSPGEGICAEPKLQVPYDHHAHLVIAPVTCAVQTHQC